MKLKVAQLSLLVFGVVLLSFAFWNWLVPRPHFITSNPQPGAVLNASPSEVVIQFTEDLAPGSTASVASTITLSATGERVFGDGKRFVGQGPGLEDRERQALRIRLDSDLPKGLYWVQWTAVAAHGGAKRSGRYCYAVGLNIPEDIVRDMPGGFFERDYRYRDNRAVLAGGILLVGLGLLLSRWPIK
jgi:methionine-rich copper-binding protein CopC